MKRMREVELRSEKKGVAEGKGDKIERMEEHGEGEGKRRGRGERR